MDKGMCGGMPYINLNADPFTYLSRCDGKDGMAMIGTVRENFEGFTEREIQGIKRASEVQAMMGHPSDSTMRHVVSQTNAVTNCPGTISDATNARIIFGPDRGSL